MDKSLIQAKLDAFNNKGKRTEKVDNSKYYWKPKMGKNQIRIIPNKDNAATPFIEMQMHYIFKYPVPALTNWGESDPVVELIKKLRKSENPEDWATAKKITPKTRTFVNVLDRDNEERGALLWEFGPGIYKELLGFANDEDYENYEDIEQGRDFTVEGEKAEMNKKEYIKAVLRPKPKVTPLHTDSDKLKDLLTNQTHPLSLYKKPTKEEILDLLDKFLNPEADEEVAEETGNEDEHSESPFKESKDEVKETPAPKKSTSKTTGKSKKIEALFSDENE